MSKKIILFALLALVGAGTWLLMSGRPQGEPTGGGAASSSSAPADAASRRVRTKDVSPVSQTRQDAASTAATAEPEPPQTEEEKAEAAAEARVDAFDALTDRWMEPAKAGVTMKDVDGFVAAFRQVPKDRQDECIHRALNLVPDDNVMLLAGVLMDKTMDKQIVEAVFNDVLNRDEDVKKPILQQIFKDKAHPCWADTAWILDVTGELPGRSGK